MGCGEMSEADKSQGISGYIPQQTYSQDISLSKPPLYTILGHFYLVEQNLKNLPQYWPWNLMSALFLLRKFA